MSTAICVTPLAKKIPVMEADYIGVDAGALKILEANLPLKQAVGDFDSMTYEEFEKLESICPIEKHPVMKDETDSELAVRLCYEKGYDSVILFGGFGGRLDHTLLNIRLLSARFTDLILMDETQKVMLLKEGEYVLYSDYKNVSLLPMEESIISYEGMLYNLDHRKISMKDTYTTSNSLTGNQAKIVIHSGCMLCIQTNEK